MSAENNKAIARRLVKEVFNRGNLRVLEEMFDSGELVLDASRHVLNMRDAAQTVQVYRKAFPDMQATVEDLVAEENTVMRGLNESVGFRPVAVETTATLVL